jgi:hypothetical protein
MIPMINYLASSTTIRLEQKWLAVTSTLAYDYTVLIVRPCLQILESGGKGLKAQTR